MCVCLCLHPLVCVLLCVYVGMRLQQQQFLLDLAEHFCHYPSHSHTLIALETHASAYICENFWACLCCADASASVYVCMRANYSTHYNIFSSGHGCCSFSALITDDLTHHEWMLSVSTSAAPAASSNRLARCSYYVVALG